MSSDSTETVELGPHYTYLIIRFFPGNLPAYLAVLCHYGETNDIFFPCGLVQLSPRNKTSTVQINLSAKAVKATSWIVSAV